MDSIINVLRKIVFWKREHAPKQQISPDATLVDVLTKMLMDRDCTVNKRAMEELASFFIATAKSALDEGMGGLEKAQRQLDDEEKKWKNKQNG